MTKGNPSISKQQEEEKLRSEIAHVVEEKIHEQLNGDFRKSNLSDSIKLLIVETVEAEVRKRIQRQEWYYYIILVIASLAASAVAFAFWHRALTDIPEAIKTELASDSSFAARTQLSGIVSNAQVEGYTLDGLLVKTRVRADEVRKNLDEADSQTKKLADDVNISLNSLPGSINTNVIVPLAKRIEELKQKDNVVLFDDLQSLFVRESISNLVDQNTLLLSFEPIPSTVKIYQIPNSGGGIFTRFFTVDTIGYCQGRGIVITNPSSSFTAQILNRISSGIVVEYVRKSPGR